MATIGSIAVNIVATTDKFTKGLQTAQTKLTGFVKGISKATAVAGAFAAYGLASVATQAIAAGDALGDAAANLGITTQAMQALEYATEQLGGSSAAMRNALARMSKTLGDAKAGSNSAVEAFKRLGISLDEITSLSPDQQFLRIVDAIRELPAAADRASAAQAIFGRGAKELMSTIEAGSGKIRAFGQELSDLGIILTDEEIANLGEAQNAIQKFTAQLEMLKLKLVGQFAPEITHSLELLSISLMQTARAFQALEVASTAMFENSAIALQMWLKMQNLLLPKKLEFDTQLIEEFIGSLRHRRKEIIQGMRGGGGPNPLNAPLPKATPEEKKIEQNTRQTNQKMDSWLQMMRNQNQPRIMLNSGPVG